MKIDFKSDDTKELSELSFAEKYFFWTGKKSEWEYPSWETMLETLSKILDMTDEELTEFVEFIRFIRMVRDTKTIQFGHEVLEDADIKPGKYAVRYFKA